MADEVLDLMAEIAVAAVEEIVPAQVAKAVDAAVARIPVAKDGRDGRDGIGAPGRDGLAGRGISCASVKGGSLTLHFTDGTAQDVGPLIDEDALLLRLRGAMSGEIKAIGDAFQQWVETRLSAHQATDQTPMQEPVEP